MQFEKKQKCGYVVRRPWKQLLIFSIPVFVGYLLQNLYNSVDSIVVGNFVGKEALAAVNATSSITMLLTGFFVGLSTGASVLFARSFGAQEYDKLRRRSTPPCCSERSWASPSPPWALSGAGRFWRSSTARRTCLTQPGST